jgi:hypothetical protein
MAQDIIMFAVFLTGGLGNQLFILYTGLAYAAEHREQMIIPELKLDIETRPTYWDTLLKKLKGGVDSTLKPGSYRRITPPDFHYTPLGKLGNKFILVGSFQSYKYFDKYAETIHKKLNIRMEQQMVRTKHVTMKNTISLHFRIGDYINIQLHHPVLQDTYYTKSIQEIIERTGKNDWNIIYFCEKKDNESVKRRLFKIKRQFPSLEFHKAADSLADWEQMLLMSCSDHNIIANSTFSWWGAYLNKNPKKIVCYPKQWFGAAYTDKNTGDICPPSWTEIN